MVPLHFEFRWLVLSMVPFQWHISKLSEAIDNDQLVPLIVAEVAIDTNQWKIHNRNI